MLLDIFNQIASISESILISNFIVASLGGKRENHRVLYTAFLSALLYIDLFILNLYVFQDQNLIAVIAILICIVFELLFLKGSIYKKLLLPILSTILTLLINVILLIVFTTAFQLDISFFTKQASTPSFMIIFLSRILYYFITYFLITIQNKNNFYLSGNEWTGVMMIYISSLCVGGSVFKMNISTGYFDSNYIVIISCGLGLINILSFYFIRKLSKDKLEKIRYSLLQVQYNNQKKDILTMNQQYNEMMKLRHDFKNYILCCQTLINEQKYEEANSYLTNLTKDKLSRIDFVLYTNNHALNAIFNAKCNLCKEKGYELLHKINDDCHEMDEMDLSILLANLLDNAIEACDKNKIKSSIFVSIDKDQSYLHFIVSNTITESILAKNPRLLTTKKDMSQHGFGMKSIHDIVSKYDGMIDFYEDQNHFYVDIWINTQFNYQ